MYCTSTLIITLFLNWLYIWRSCLCEVSEGIVLGWMPDEGSYFSKKHVFTERSIYDAIIKGPYKVRCSTYLIEKNPVNSDFSASDTTDSSALSNSADTTDATGATDAARLFSIRGSDTEQTENTKVTKPSKIKVSYARITVLGLDQEDSENEGYILDELEVSNCNEFSLDINIVGTPPAFTNYELIFRDVSNKCWKRSYVVEEAQNFFTMVHTLEPEKTDCSIFDGAYEEKKLKNMEDYEVAKKEFLSLDKEFQSLRNELDKLQRTENVKKSGDVGDPQSLQQSDSAKENSADVGDPQSFQQADSAKENSADVGDPQSFQQADSAKENSADVGDPQSFQQADSAKTKGEEKPKSKEQREMEMKKKITKMGFEWTKQWRQYEKTKESNEYFRLGGMHPTIKGWSPNGMYLQEEVEEQRYVTNHVIYFKQKDTMLLWMHCYDIKKQGGNILHVASIFMYGSIVVERLSLSTCSEKAIKASINADKDIGMIYKKNDGSCHKRKYTIEPLKPDEVSSPVVIIKKSVAEKLTDCPKSMETQMARWRFRQKYLSTVFRKKKIPQTKSDT